MKAFKNLSKAEQGVILLAIHNGERVEIKPNASAGWKELTKLYPASVLVSTAIVRIKPIPRVIYTSNAGFNHGEWSSEYTPNRPIKFIECMEGE